MHNLCGFFVLFSKIIFNQKLFLIAAINLTTRGPLYTCLVDICRGCFKDRRAYDITYVYLEVIIFYTDFEVKETSVSLPEKVKMKRSLGPQNIRH